RLDVLGLRLRKRGWTDVHIVVARTGGVLDRGARRIVLWIVPQEIEVAIQVHADAVRTVGAWRRRSTVLPPHGGARHAPVASIRIHLWEDEQVERVDDLLNVAGTE